MYQPKTPPYEWQTAEFAANCEATNHALFCEPRTGKTKAVLDLAAHQYERWTAAGAWQDPAHLPQQGITALLVVAAPGRVHRNWVAYEVPAHLPDRVPRTCVVWDSGRVRYNLAKKRFEGPLAPRLLDLLDSRGLAVLAVNEGAMLTDALLRYLPKFLRARHRVLVAVDEFTLVMASAGSKTTQKMWKLARQPQVVMRRILDGTPMEAGPLDLYAPFAFLDRRILGHDTSASYRAHFAKWKTGVFRNKSGNLQEYPTLERDDDGRPVYQHLEELQSRLAPYTTRVRRSDCWDAPSKIYQIHSFQLSAEQRRVYDQLRDEFITEIAGHSLSAKHVLTRYMRLQQVCSNFWPSEKVATIHEACNGLGCEACEDLGVIVQRTALRRIDPRNDPRIEAARQVLTLNRDRPTIIWARFHEDVDNLMKLAHSMGLAPVQYDGRLSATEKDESSDAFRAGHASPLIGNPASGGRGLNLSRATLIVQHSSTFSLLTRIQGEDRAEARGKTEGTGIVDIVAEDTIDDTTILPALRAKKEIVDFILQERNGKWL